MSNSFTEFFNRENGFPFSIIFFLSFLTILLFSLSPSVYVGDSPIFASASYFLGSAHPPAYPLYALFGKLMTFIPFGNVALKVNLLSAVSGALAAALAYRSATYVTKSPVISLFAPLLILASPNFILESSKSEVYSFNSFWAMIIFYYGMKALKEEDFFKSIVFSFFILGLAMANHHTIGFMLFLLLFVVVVRRKELPPGTIVAGIVVFLAGFSVYLYLYLRTLSHAFIHYSEVNSLYDFLGVFFRANYSASTVDSIKTVSYQGSAWLYTVRNIGLILSPEFHPITWFFVIAGFLGVVKDRKLFGYFLISILVWVLLAKMTVSEKEPTRRTLEIVDVYFLQMIPILGVIAARGLFACYEKVKVKSHLIAKVLVTAFILFQIVFVSISFQKSSLSDYFVAYGWIKDVSKVLKPKSFYLTYGDNPGFLSFYGFGVERLRDDVLCLDATTGNNVFSLTLSPRWKFGVWYPEFYETELTPTKYFIPVAREGKFYSTFIGSIPPKIRNKFDVRQYVLTSILLAKDSNVRFNEMFRDDFGKIDYLPIISRKETDFMAAELIKGYAFTLWEYAKILAAENSKDADFYYKLAIFTEKDRELKYQVIKDYVRFLEEKKGVAEARRFISRLEESAADARQKKELADIEKTIVWQ